MAQNNLGNMVEKYTTRLDQQITVGICVVHAVTVHSKKRHLPDKNDQSDHSQQKNKLKCIRKRKTFLFFVFIVGFRRGKLLSGNVIWFVHACLILSLIMHSSYHIPFVM